MGFGSDLYIKNVLVDMYCRFNDMNEARGMFEEMPLRDVSWNCLISWYSANGYWNEVLEIYYRSRINVAWFIIFWISAHIHSYACPLQGEIEEMVEELVIEVRAPLVSGFWNKKIIEWGWLVMIKTPKGH